MGCEQPAGVAARGPAARPPTGRVLGTFVLGALGIAFSALFVRLALPAPPLVTGFYRMLLALPLLALLVGLRRGAAPADRAGLRWAGVAGLALGTDLALWHLSLVRTSVATSTLLVNTTPVWVGLHAAWVLRERPGRPFVTGAATALLGTALLLDTDRGAAGVGLAGGGLALAAALFYAAYLVLMKRARRVLDAPPALLTATATAVAVLGLSAALNGDPFTGFPAHAWAAFTGAAVVSQVAGVLGIAWGLRWLRATFASVTLLVQPVGTALLGWLLLGEALGPVQALGGAFVLAGIVLASRAALDPHPGGPSGRRDTDPRRPPTPPAQSRKRRSSHQG